MKRLMTIVGVAGAVLLGGPAALAATAGGPVKTSGARITALAYYGSGKYHGAMDIGGAGCYTRNTASSIYHRAMILQTRYYRYSGGCGMSCRYQIGNKCNGGAGNMIKTVGKNGYDFRQMHINHNSTLSRSKTCYRCGFGLVGSTGNSSGAHVHAANLRYGTKTTYWYTRIGKRVGNSGAYGYTMGYPGL